MIEFGGKSKFECRFEPDLSEPKDEACSDSRLSDACLRVLAKDLYLVIPEGDEDEDDDEDENDEDEDDGDDTEKDDEDNDDEDGVNDSYEVINDCLVTKILIVTFSRSTF